MKKSRRKFSSDFKSRVAIEALKERQTLSELAVKFDLHPNQISQWKQDFLNGSHKIFEKSNNQKQEKLVDLESLYSKIGQLEMERDYLKKNLNKLGHLI